MVALAFLALASLAVLSAFVFSGRLDTKREGQHRAALIALDSMEEARAQITAQFDVTLDIPKMEHVDIPGLYLERTTDYVGDEIGVEDGKLREVTVVVTWGSDQKPQRYLLKERFLRP